MSHDHGPLIAQAASAVSPLRPPDVHADASAISPSHLPPDALGRPPQAEPIAEILVLLQRLAVGVETLSNEVRRVADHVSPEPGDLVGTPYIAGRLGCTKTWAAELVRKGEIPKDCVVSGTGHGRLWKFHKRQLDAWLHERQ